MSFKKKIIDLLNRFEDLFMTSHSCMSCGKEIEDGTKFNLCENCLNSLDKIEGRLCKKCGEEIVGENVRVCDYCKERDYKFNSNHSCFYYNAVSASIIKNFKYNGRKYYAKSIAEIMAQRSDFFEDVDVITFVPINKKRKRERGFNQSEEIAKHLSKMLNIPLVTILEKEKDGKHQAALGQKDRLKNLKGSFKIIAENVNKVRGKRVIIVDDVFTTGATLNECARVIRVCRPISVNTVTFAKTKFNSAN